MKKALADPTSITALSGHPTPGARGLEGGSGLSCLSESFTPDHKPLLGEAPELRGFFLGCGFNSAGECGQPPTRHPCGLSFSSQSFPRWTGGWGAVPVALQPLTGVVTGNTCRAG